jgi:putative spermidine/putrescine transport system permease protein/mannopine transport system permease protein
MARVARNRFWLLLPIVALNAILVLVPLALMAKTSFGAGIGGYRQVLASPLLEPIVVNTLAISTTTTVLAVMLAYICAAAAWRAAPVPRAIILAFVLLPFWTGVLVKNFAWAVLLQDNGVINNLLQGMGFSGPVTILHTRSAVIIGMVHYVAPYAVLPIFAAMLAIEGRLEQAAASLGATSWRIARHIILPLTLPGVYVSTLLVFIISTGFFITPVVLGGPGDQMVANLVEYYARDLVDFRAASVLAMLVAVAVSLIVVVYQRLPKEGQYGAG